LTIFRVATELRKGVRKISIYADWGRYIQTACPHFPKPIVFNCESIYISNYSKIDNQDENILSNVKAI